VEELQVMGRLRFRIEMKNFDVIPQEKYDFCVCSVLQAILRRYNINLSQNEIANNLTPCQNGGYKVNDASISNFLLSKGFRYEHYFWNETPFHEPDSLLEEMNKNEGSVSIGRHWYILKNFNDPNLEIIDPKDGEIIKKSIYGVLKEMHEKDGGFGLIKKL
jgi:ABC-type bacteriocin/lantibiotic exporter with double-glycine peptidase domain